MNQHWIEKKQRSTLMSNDKIDYLYNEGLKNELLEPNWLELVVVGFLCFMQKILKIKRFFSKNIEVNSNLIMRL